MISFELNGKKYSSPKGWENITFEKFLKYLSEVAPKTPEILRSLFESENLAEAWNFVMIFLLCLSVFGVACLLKKLKKV
jgi:hypothetical protein